MRTSPTALLTLGRLPKALDIARALYGAGWRVLVAEPFARHLTGASNSVSRSIQVTAPTLDAQAYLQELRQIITAESVDLIVPVSEETMHVAALHGCGVRLFTMPPNLVRYLYDKLGFIQFSQSLGLTVPRTTVLSDPATAAIFRSSPVVVKPRQSCGGRGVQFFQALPELKGDVRADAQTDDHLIVQEWISGAVHSTCSVVHEGRCLGTVVYRAAQLSGSVAVAFERIDHLGIEAWVETFARASNWSGFLSFDFVVDDTGTPYGIECNPRATSGIHFFAQSDLGAAMINPQAVGQLGLRPERRLQQFWACLTEVQKQPFGRHLMRGLGQLFSTPDVTWRRTDPWPLLGMPYTAWPIIAAANREGVSFGEVATRDLDWRGSLPEPPVPSAP